MSDQDEYGHYSMILEWDPRDDIYIATVPELPGCRTHGETLEEAVRQGRDALESWIDANRFWGRPIPPPRFFQPESDPEEASATSEAVAATG
jgi:predicted RNase H-like HicB family nuclease